ncbi:MAG TPA: response regulator transcription factor [Anaerolineales bacterium]|nr:response regulator transcription factor [Anaerolineales bacterium]
MSERLRIVLADDHELVLEGLRGLLASEADMEVMATVTDGAALLSALERQLPDVVVVDLQMPTVGGLSCLTEIRRRGWPVKVLVLTAFSDGESIQSALEGGADGFALKTAPPRQTIEAIRQVGQGNLVFPPAARKWMSGHKPAPGPELSEREWEVLELVAKGLTNRQITETLSVSENTVKFHLQNIFQKLGVNNRTEAAGYYFRVRGAHPPG